jgi:PilZ domain
MELQVANDWQSGSDQGDHGRESRAKVSLDCEVRQGVRPWKLTRLEDISPSGFKIAWFPNVQPDLPLRIRIPGLELLTAEVRWQRDNSVGCSFVTPLYPAVYDHIVRQTQRG